MERNQVPSVPKSLAVDESKKDTIHFVNYRTKEEVDLDFNSLKRVQLTLRALNHPLRKEILQVVEQRKKITVTDLYSRLRIEQSLASQQIGLLRRAGALTATRNGKFIYYSINTARLGEIVRFIEALQNSRQIETDS